MKLCLIFFLLVPLVLVSASLSSDKKIANGQDAYDGQFPYVASYQYNTFHYCGCTIISQYWLLTAAHCIATVESLPGFNINLLTAVAGITNLYVNPPGKQVKKVRKQFIHHGFNGNTLVNDIGLIVVWDGFTVGNGVSYISYSMTPTYADIIITGWGYLRSTYPDPSPKLQYAIGKRVTNPDCQMLVYPTNAVVTANMICMTGRYKQNETSCNGDSGGPLIQVFPYPYYDRQVGIMSWDLKPCGLRGKPSVGTLIYPYFRWMECIFYYQNGGQCILV
ncbi:hypothetical protein RN001_014176 [Aquatica leii]|uniref:Peptidase S1 domain-containing protein n=1 Tax=Aquatica leii TaxID=1421715 RepID=A0AAN7S7D4_9COLE|nr:hypothetical protein RN001_014176 [Aquatica leii]